MSQKKLALAKDLSVAWLELQQQRFVLRWIIIRPGLISAVFWAIALIGDSWLRSWGLQYLGFVALGLWIGLSFPIIYVQGSLILDLMGYVLTGRTSFFPRLMQAGKEAHERLVSAEAAAPRLQRYLNAFVKLLGNTSPISCLATWAMVVLVRMPESVHALGPQEAALRVPEARQSFELGVFDTAYQRLAHH